MHFKNKYISKSIFYKTSFSFNKLLFKIICVFVPFLFLPILSFSNTNTSNKFSAPPAPINDGGIISADEVSNGTYDPALITSISGATGTVGNTLAYQWQLSTDGSNWSNIAGATNATYDPVAITVTTYYRRLSKFTNGESFGSRWNGLSNVVTKAVTNYTITSSSTFVPGSNIDLTHTGVFPLLYDNKILEGYIPNQSSQFLSDYTFSASSTTAGNFGINRDFQRWNGGYNSNYSNHTYLPPTNTNDEGFMLLFNGSPTANTRAWYKNVNVTAGNTYRFSVWVRSDNNTNQPQIQWMVNGTPVGTAVTANSGAWQEVTYTFVASTTGTITAAIFNNRLSGSGNDFALDDITIIEDEPVTYSWTGPNGFTSNLANPTIVNAGSSAAGLYELTITKNGISITVSRYINENTTVCIPPTFNLNSIDVLCYNQANGSITVNNPIGYGGTGNITYQTWTGIAGTLVSDLTSNGNYPGSPNSTVLKTSMEGDVNVLDNMGGRLIGYIVPRVSGNYTFWIAADDNAELWISTNSSPANRVLRASVNDWTNYQEWNKFPSQKSVVISLTAGQIYYIEAIYKEGTGGDNISVGWLKPGQTGTVPSEVIPSSAIRPFLASSLTTPVFQYRFLYWRDLVMVPYITEKQY